MSTQEVHLSKRNRQLGKTSECTHKMSNSQHGIAHLDRLPNVHPRGPTLQNGKGESAGLPNVHTRGQLSTRDGEFGKTSECAHKR
ncbi:hypothetical protein PoB_003930100 [Plakobranchus ocellatus]|uniref:Uncharacterized protein n=1 Tax=Plakobranchus ocellatus TaxID=259542 RepID=A0AAV4B1U9_9GAST|nr:hypothetical protein PoB_003930100 [Plakobranchus ocellatus]